MVPLHWNQTTGFAPLKQRTAEGRPLRSPSLAEAGVELSFLPYCSITRVPDGWVCSANLLLIGNGICNRQSPMSCKEMSTHRKERQLKIRAPCHPMPALSTGPLDPSGLPSRFRGSVVRWEVPQLGKLQLCGYEASIPSIPPTASISHLQTRAVLLRII